MKTEQKYWFALATILLIFSGVAAASTYELQLDPKVPVKGSTLYMTVLKDNNPEPEVVVHFFLNKDLPVLTITDDQGKARFKPLVDGYLDIYATTKDGVLLASWHQSISPSTGVSSGGSGDGTYPTATSTPARTQTTPSTSSETVVQPELPQSATKQTTTAVVPGETVT
jgi:hypothetical protein